MLIAHGIDINAVNSVGLTALQVLAQPKRCLRGVATVNGREIMIFVRCNVALQEMDQPLCLVSACNVISLVPQVATLRGHTEAAEVIVAAGAETHCIVLGGEWGCDRTKEMLQPSCPYLPAMSSLWPRVLQAPSGTSGWAAAVRSHKCSTLVPHLFHKCCSLEASFSAFRCVSLVLTACLLPLVLTACLLPFAADKHAFRLQGQPR